MARKGRGHFEVVQLGEVTPTIEPPSHLNAAEKSLFHAIVRQAGPLSFVRTDAQLLAAYVQACCLTALAYESALASPSHMCNWQRATKVMMALAGKLRLCPSARVDPKTLSRAYAGRNYTARPDQEMIAAAKAGTTGRGWKARG